MTPVTIGLLALASFVLGLSFGHRWGRYDADVEANAQQRRCHRLLRFATPYIDAHAEAQGWTVERNADGEILDLHEPPIRCGTPRLAHAEVIADAKRRKSLH